MIRQIEFSLKTRSRGFYLVTEEIRLHLPELPKQGLVNLFLLHTSASLTINENADPTVLQDFEEYFNHIVPENMSFIKHDFEGPDDMPAHIKSTLASTSLTIPITNGSLRLGTWQGIYLCEFRNRPHSRRLIATIYS